MKSDFYVAVGTTAVSAVALVTLYTSKAAAFGISNLDSNSFPKIIAWILLGLGLLMTAIEIVHGKVSLPRLDMRVFYSRYKKPVGMLMLLTVYVLLLGKIGFFVTTGAFVLGSTLFIGGLERPWRAVAITAGAVAILYLVFRLWLGQILPGGWLI